MPALSFHPTDNWLPAALAGLILVAVSPTLQAQRLELHLASQDQVEKRLQAGVVASAKRQETIRNLFADAGCQPTEQKVDRRSANIICKLPGETNDTVIVGGHFDFVDRGQGIIDDWSGTSLLPSLYQALKQHKWKNSFEFVAFAQEERGLVGSRLYVKSLSEEQKVTTRAFINLECLGVTPPKVWTKRATPLLLNHLLQIANATHIPLQGVNVDDVGDDDTHPFLSKKIPVISIHSLTQETLPLIHSARDTVSAIHPDFHYEAYRLVAFYLAYLDAKLPG